MKKMAHFVIATLTFYILLPGWSAMVLAQAIAPLPQVPITYPGDTDKTIIRRAQLIEGAKKEGALVWWSSERPEQLQILVNEFNKIYPFIKVTFWRGQDVERVTRLEAEHAIGRVSVDISDGDFTSYTRWRKIGLADKYTDFIPGLKNMDPRTYSKYGDWAQLGNNATVPMYNTNLVSPADAPKSWEDLLSPKWKGQIGLTPNMRTWYTLALSEGGWGIEKTEEFLRKLKQQEPIWAAGVTAGYNLMIAGEFKIMGESFLRFTFEAKKKNLPVDWVRVRPVPITGGPPLLPKKAPHPNAARLFIEWLFSPQVAPLIEQVTGYGSPAPHSGTMLSKALEGLPLVYRTEEVGIKTAELRLEERFVQILGVKPK